MIRIFKRLFDRVFDSNGGEAVSSSEEVQRRVTEMLRPYFDDHFVVYYDPSFPQTPQTTISIFQVVFAVGPGEDAEMRSAVHRRFEELLGHLSPIPEVRTSRSGLRARRHVPPRSTPTHPHMFIECAWDGAKLQAVIDGDFHAWHSLCDSYVNRFDKSDALNTAQSGAEI